MSIKAISSSRTAPVTEDLTTPDNQLAILRGFENMFRVDKKVGDGQNFQKGEWAVLQGDETVERPGDAPVAQTYLVFAGTDRFDAEATGQVSLVFGGSIIVKTTQYNKEGNYSVGDKLTVRSLGTGSAVVTPVRAGNAEDIPLAEVIAVGNGTLTYQVLR